MNAQFLELHHKSSKNSLKNIHAVLVFKCGVLSLWLNQDNDFHETVIEPITSEHYHTLKSACHMPIILLDGIAAQCIDKEALQALQNTMHQCSKQLDLDANHKKSIINIMQYSIECIDELLECHSLTLNNVDVLTSLNKLKERTHQDIDYLSEQATIIQLNLLHMTTCQWISNYSLELAKTRVLLVAPHGPRKGYIEMQYFLKRYEKELHGANGPIKNNYVYYVEIAGSRLNTVCIKDELIDGFLAGEEQNKLVANWLLNDSLAMQQDVLKDKAPQIIQQLLSKQCTQTPLSQYFS